MNNQQKQEDQQFKEIEMQEEKLELNDQTLNETKQVRLQVENEMGDEENLLESSESQNIQKQQKKRLYTTKKRKTTKKQEVIKFIIQCIIAAGLSFYFSIIRCNFNMFREYWTEKDFIKLMWVIHIFEFGILFSVHHLGQLLLPQHTPKRIYNKGETYSLITKGINQSIQSICIYLTISSNYTPNVALTYLLVTGLARLLLNNLLEYTSWMHLQVQGVQGIHWVAMVFMIVVYLAFNVVLLTFNQINQDQYWLPMVPVAVVCQAITNIITKRYLDKHNNYQQNNQYLPVILDSQLLHSSYISLCLITLYLLYNLYEINTSILSQPLYSIPFHWGQLAKCFVIAILLTLRHLLHRFIIETNLDTVIIQSLTLMTTYQLANYYQLIIYSPYEVGVYMSTILLLLFCTGLTCPTNLAHHLHWLQKTLLLSTLSIQLLSMLFYQQNLLQHKIINTYSQCSALVYSPCIASGGPEDLHILAHQMDHLHYKTLVVYSNTAQCKKLQHDQLISPNTLFPQYHNWFITGGLIQAIHSQQSSVSLSHQNLMVLPEVFDLKHQAQLYPRYKIIMYWLSFTYGLNNYRMLNATLLKQRQLDNIIFLLQNDYARQELKHLLNTTHQSIPFLDLEDYVNPIFLESNKKHNKNRDIDILYSVMKDDLITPSFCSQHPQYTCLGLDKSRSFIELESLYSRCKMWVDMGTFPGQEKMPREAAVMGAVVVTGSKGDANPKYIDYQFTLKAQGMQDLLYLVQAVQQNYTHYYQLQQPFRDKLFNQKRVFEKQVLQFVNQAMPKACADNKIANKQQEIQLLKQLRDFKDIIFK